MLFLQPYATIIYLILVLKWLIQLTALVVSIPAKKAIYANAHIAYVLKDKEIESFLPAGWKVDEGAEDEEGPSF